MRIRVQFECELEQQENMWAAVNEEIKKTTMTDFEQFEVFDVETGAEFLEEPLEGQVMI